MTFLWLHLGGRLLILKIRKTESKSRKRFVVTPNEEIIDEKQKKNLTDFWWRSAQACDHIHSTCETLKGTEKRERERRRDDGMREERERKREKLRVLLFCMLLNNTSGKFIPRRIEYCTWTPLILLAYSLTGTWGIHKVLSRSRMYWTHCEVSTVYTFSWWFTQSSKAGFFLLSCLCHSFDHLRFLHLKADIIISLLVVWTFFSNSIIVLFWWSTIVSIAPPPL